jgi:hypothetical protein
MLFNGPVPSSRTMALGLTQLLTEMSTKNLPWGKQHPAHKADNLTICKLTVSKMRQPQHPTNLWAAMAYYRNSFTFFIIF